MSPSRLHSALVAGATFIIANGVLPHVAAADSCSSNTLTYNYSNPVAADGWSYRLIANGFKDPRSIAFDSEGALLVVDAGEGLYHLALDDNGGTCLSVSKKTTLIPNGELNHGLAIAPNGSTILASTSDVVYSWTYDAKGVSVSDTNRSLITNMSSTDHTTRTLLIPKMQPDMLVVSRGSDSNMDPEAAQLNSGHSQIRVYNMTSFETNSSAVEFLEGKLLGWGLRNSVGVGQHPETGGIWAVENSVDQLSRDNQDIHQNNPAEELNFLGFLNGSTEHQGGNYGYPYCYTLWSTQNFPELGSLTTGDQFPSGEVKTLTDNQCNTDYVDPRLAFQAHMAPLDIIFNNNGSTAYISFHGSWDRTDPVGYKIVTVDFDTTTGQPVAAQDSMDAAVDLISNPDNSKCPDGCFRPVGLAWDSKGRLWFSSSSTGEIFVLENAAANPNGVNSTGSGNSSSSSGDDSAGSQLMPSGKVAWVVTAAAIVAGVFLA